MATQGWINIFPEAKLFHLTSSVSNHSPLALRLVRKLRNKRARKIFRFEAMWLRNQRCEEVVQNAREEGKLTSSGCMLGSCLEKCRSKLETWNKMEFGHVGRRVTEVQKRLEWIELQPPSPAINQELKRTRVELNCWLEKEADMWRQQSRLTWLQSGDRNTGFFHAKASARHKKNSIEGIMDANEVWHVDDGKVEEVLVDYYKELFTTSQPTEFSEMLQTAQPKVTNSMNQLLTRDFSAAEFRVALKQMYPLKAPGPDGMPPLFFQHFWLICGEVVIATVLDFLNNGICPPDFNKTHIILIPKVKSPKKVTGYRPISLCNVVYKLASKTIANRLKKILPSIISDTQSAFVHGRLITNNVLVAFETMHHIS